MDEQQSVSLLKLIRSEVKQLDTDAIDPAKIRYLLYARKSTENEDRQARSIPDQIKDCFETVITNNGIAIPEKSIIREEKSAKEAGTRPEFKRMMDLIKEGKYDGIISWHPDRLARNMKEAGELIELIDTGMIKDLRFARAHFENTPNGKMMLGISFVLSKHYSEHLSESVTRGNRRITESGHVLRNQIHGYVVTEDHRLVADEANYLFIEQAFKMRSERKGLAEIVGYLNGTGYQVYRKKRGHADYKFNVNAVSNMLRDPIYAGVILYGKNSGLLTEIDEGFTAMISEEQFLEINGAKNFLSHKFTGRVRVAPATNSDFLRRMVKCADCSRFMTTTITHKWLDKEKTKKDYYFYFKCETKACPMKGSGPRGQVLLDFAYKFLNEIRFTGEANFERYKIDAEQNAKKTTAQTETFIKSRTALRTKKITEFENAKIMAADKENPLHKYYTASDLAGLERDIKNYTDEIDKAKKLLIRQSDAIGSYADYLELYDNVADLLYKTTSMETADEIIRIFFSNFTVKGEAKAPAYKQKQWPVSDYCLEPPYDEFVATGEIFNGRGERTRTSGLLLPKQAR